VQSRGRAKEGLLHCRGAKTGEGPGKGQSAIDVQNRGMKRCTVEVQSVHLSCADIGPTMGKGQGSVNLL